VRSKSKDIVAKIAIIAAVCIGFVAFEWFMEGELPAGAVAITTTIPVAKAKGLDTLLGLNSTFLTYAVALFGGIGFFLKGVLKKEFGLSVIEWWFLVISGTFALLSIFFGHLLPYFCAVMLENDILELNAGAVVWPLRLQYLSLMLSASLFLLGALSAARRNHKPAEAEAETPTA